MKYLFYVAGGLLVLSGILRLVQVFTSPFSTAAILPFLLLAVLGLIYLLVGGMLILGREGALRYGIILSAIGVLLTLLFINSGSNSVLYLVIDGAVILICLFLLRAGNPVIRRVNKS